MVSILAFYSDDPSSNPAEAYSVSVKCVFEKNENKKRPGFKKVYAYSYCYGNGESQLIKVPKYEK